MDHTANDTHVIVGIITGELDSYRSENLVVGEGNPKDERDGEE